MKIDLSHLNESYHSAVLGFAGALPNGNYKARLVSAEVSSSKNNNLQVKWFLEAETPSGELGTTIKFSPLVEKSLPYLKMDLRTLGIILDDLNELYALLPNLAGTMIEIEVQDDFATGSHRVSFVRQISRFEFD